MRFLQFLPALVMCVPAFAHDPALQARPPSAAGVTSFMGDEAVDRLEKALAEARRNMEQAIESGVSARDTNTARSVIATTVLWMPADLTVCFWNGDDDVKSRVAQYARVWTEAANVRLSFHVRGSFRQCANSQSADIRIAFGPGGSHTYARGQDPFGNWSQIGRQSRGRVDVSMNLYNVPGFVQARVDDQAAFLVRHEFGHALAAMHEHQRSDCATWFDLDAMARDLNWSIDLVRENVVSFSAREASAYGLREVGPYDRDSIMQYNFSPSWYKNIAGQVNPCRRRGIVSELSAYDIHGIQAMYGAPSRGTGARTAAAPPSDAVAQDMRAAGADGTDTTVPKPTLAETETLRKVGEARSQLEQSHRQLAREAAIIAAQHTFSTSMSTGRSSRAPTDNPAAPPIDPALGRQLSDTLMKRAQALGALIQSVDQVVEAASAGQ